MILILSPVDLRVMRFVEITESKFLFIFSVCCPVYHGHRNFIVVIILTSFGDVVTVLIVLFVFLCCNTDFHKTQCENRITSAVDHNHHYKHRHYSVVCP